MSKFIVEKQIKGAIAENLAKNYFLSKGFLVFPSLTAQGCIDMIVVDESNQLKKIECQTTHQNQKTQC